MCENGRRMRGFCEKFSENVIFHQSLLDALPVVIEAKPTILVSIDELSFENFSALKIAIAAGATVIALCGSKQSDLINEAKCNGAIIASDTDQAKNLVRSLQQPAMESCKTEFVKETKSLETELRSQGQLSSNEFAALFGDM